MSSRALAAPHRHLFPAELVMFGLLALGALAVGVLHGLPTKPPVPELRITDGESPGRNDEEESPVDVTTLVPSGEGRPRLSLPNAPRCVGPQCRNPFAR